jgi:uncharacterized protein YbbK (DUF523 family)
MKYVVSMCLYGIDCRYDGTSSKIDEIVKLVNEGKAIMICPEQLGGLPTPRDASEIICRNNARHVVSKAGRILDHEFQIGANEALKIAQMFGAQKAILKSRSPSCGHGQIYDGTFSGTLTCGNGITAQLFINNGFEIFDENNFKLD